MKRRMWCLGTLIALVAASQTLASQGVNLMPGVWLSSTAAQLAPLPEGREGYCLGKVGSRIYMTHGDSSAIGDSGDVRVYSVPANTWSSRTSSPNARAEGAGTSQGGLIYCLGGRAGSGVLSLVEVYTPTADSWATLASMSVARAGLGVTVAGNRIFAIGGRSVGSGPCSGAPISPGQAEVYDIASDTWSPISDPPVPVTDAAAVTVGELIYLIGGCDSSNLQTTNLQIYNPTTDTWAAGPSMPTARASLAAASVGNTIFAIGGLDVSGGTNLSVVEGYDVNHGVWVTGYTPKTTPASEIQAVTHGGRIYVPGSGSFGTVSPVFEAFQR